jgi:hypothetical protein
LEKCDNTAVGDIDIATEMAKIKTQTCTQATEEKCTKIWLDANINVGRDGDGGIIAAYCTDRYLVLQTTMKAGWGLDIMNSISQPPGNSDNTCVTGEISATMNRLETHIFPLEHVYDLWDTDNNTQNADYFENGAQQATPARTLTTAAETLTLYPAIRASGSASPGSRFTRCTATRLLLRYNRAKWTRATNTWGRAAGNRTCTAIRFQTRLASVCILQKITPTRLARKT